MAKYILRNISKNDIILSDLRYKIPAGHSRDLLSDTARLDPQTVMQSKLNGSISKRLGKTLIEVQEQVSIKLPAKSRAKTASMTNLRKTKPSMIINDGAVTEEELQNISTNEDDEYLKQMELDSQSEPSNVPIISKE
jgi:hypothetical protein